MRPAPAAVVLQAGRCRACGSRFMGRSSLESRVGVLPDLCQNPACAGVVSGIEGVKLTELFFGAEVKRMMMGRMLQHCKIFLLFVCLYIQPALLEAKSKVVINGSCQQFNEIVSKGKEATAEEAFIFSLYRAMINGQVTVYNHALLAAGYKKLLVPPDTVNPEIIFPKKLQIDCKQVESEPDQISLLAAQNIIDSIKNDYKDQSISLDFKEIFNPAKKQLLFSSKQVVVDFGNDSCRDFSKITKEKPYFNYAYKYWAVGYFVPFVMIEKLDSNQVWLIMDEIYKTVSQHL
ncbi:MAG: hypothetical protein R3E95_16360 [Thiolinea sp.]